MVKIAANLTMLFNEVPFLDRFQRAKAAGFEGVEYLFPYDFDKNELSQLLKNYQLTQVLHNLPAGNWAEGERGIACHPDRTEEFRQGVDLAIDYAQALNCRQLNVLAGIAPADVSDALLKSTFIQNIQYAADRLSKYGIDLLIEAINTFDIPGFYVNKTSQVADLISESGRDNVYIQYDIYHMQRMEGELTHTIKKYLPQIKHLQLADNPGRNEPGTGEINYQYLFNQLRKMNYHGWVGCEYKPQTTTDAGLHWREILTH